MIQTDTEKTSRIKPWGFSVGKWQTGRVLQRGITYSDLCTQACPYRLTGSALPGQRRSVSLRFRVAMLLKTQFACHRVRGKQRLRKKKIIFFIIFIYAFMYIPCRILTAPVGRVWRLIAFSRRSAPKNTIRLPSLLITTAQEWRQRWIAFWKEISDFSPNKRKNTKPQVVPACLRVRGKLTLRKKKI